MVLVSSKIPVLMGRAERCGRLKGWNWRVQSIRERAK